MLTEIPNMFSSVLNGKYFDPILRQRVLEWQEEPFRRFLLDNDSKVSAKFSNLIDLEGQRDIGLELFVARMFTVVGCSLQYEPRKDGPDFKVTYQGESFFCEVRRIREDLPPLETDYKLLDFPPDLFHKIGDILCEKFLQLEPGNSNVIYIRSNRFLMQKLEFDSAVKSLAELADDHQSSFFRGKGFKDEQHFLDQTKLCSAVLFHHFWTNSDSDKPFSVSLNPNAAYPLSEKLVRLLHAAADIEFKVGDRAAAHNKQNNDAGE